MRIKSKFKDYYDGAAQLHVEEPVWIRNTETFQFQYYWGTGFKPNENPKHVQAVTGFKHHLLDRILFCGRVYNFYNLQAADMNLTVPLEAERYSKNCWTLAPQDIGWIRKIHRISPPSQRYRWTRNEVDGIDKLIGDLSVQGKHNSAVAAWQETHKLPVVHLSRGATYSGLVVLNPKLSDLDFAKVMQPQQAWQELSMWWGNLAMPERNTVTISDKDRHAQHGFDKFSFRRTGKDLRDAGALPKTKPKSV